MRIQQAKDLYELADEGQEKIDAKAALKRELQKEVPKHEDMLAKVKADANTNPSARSEGASMLSWAWFPGRGSLGREQCVGAWVGDASLSQVLHAQEVSDESVFTLEMPKSMHLPPQGILTPVNRSRRVCVNDPPGSCDSWEHGHGLAEFLEAEGMLASPP